jgi:hypothetical protein
MVTDTIDMSNYKMGRKIGRKGAEGEKGRKSKVVFPKTEVSGKAQYVIFFLFSPSFFALCAFAVKNSSSLFFSY